MTCKLYTQRYAHDGANDTHDVQTIHMTVYTRQCKLYTRRANYTHDGIHDVQIIHMTVYTQ